MPWAQATKCPSGGGTGGSDAKLHRDLAKTSADARDIIHATEGPRQRNLPGGGRNRYQPGDRDARPVRSFSDGSHMAQ